MGIIVLGQAAKTDAARWAGLDKLGNAIARKRLFGEIARKVQEHQKSAAANEVVLVFGEAMFGAHSRLQFGPAALRDAFNVPESGFDVSYIVSYYDTKEQFQARLVERAPPHMRAEKQKKERADNDPTWKGNGHFLKRAKEWKAEGRQVDYIKFDEPKEALLRSGFLQNFLARRGVSPPAAGASSSSAAGAGASSSPLLKRRKTEKEVEDQQKKPVAKAKPKSAPKGAKKKIALHLSAARLKIQLGAKAGSTLQCVKKLHAKKKGYAPPLQKKGAKKLTLAEVDEKLLATADELKELNKRRKVLKAEKKKLVELRNRLDTGQGGASSSRAPPPGGASSRADPVPKPKKSTLPPPNDTAAKKTIRFCNKNFPLVSSHQAKELGITYRWVVVEDTRKWTTKTGASSSRTQTSGTFQRILFCDSAWKPYQAHDCSAHLVTAMRDCQVNTLAGRNKAKGILLEAHTTTQFPFEEKRPGVVDVDTQRFSMQHNTGLQTQYNKIDPVLASPTYMRDRNSLNLVTNMFMRKTHPDFHFDAVQHLLCVKTTLHVDKTNAGFSRVLSLGNAERHGIW